MVTTLAATNKCLAQNNKSLTGAKRLRSEVAKERVAAPASVGALPHHYQEKQMPNRLEWWRDRLTQEQHARVFGRMPKGRADMGKSWARADLFFLKDSLERGMSLAEIAGFLGRTADEVREKARGLEQISQLV